MCYRIFFYSVVPRLICRLRTSMRCIKTIVAICIKRFLLPLLTSIRTVRSVIYKANIAHNGRNVVSFLSILKTSAFYKIIISETDNGCIYPDGMFRDAHCGRLNR